MAEWTEKYRPRRLDDIAGNAKARTDLRKWAESWLIGIPEKRAVVLIGEPGIGKTTAALALANDMGWQILEMNASDSRNADAIKNIATLGAMGETFTDTGEFAMAKDGHRKLIVLDEADNIFGKEDFGGVKAIAQTILSTKQPIILIVNDWYALHKRSSIIKDKTMAIKFSKPDADSVVKLLRNIARAEGVEVPDEIFMKIAKKNGGDVRSSVNDLQSLSEGRDKIEVKDLSSLGGRDITSNIFDTVNTIFQSGNCKRSRDAAMNLEEDPDTLILWIDHNIPSAYRDPADMHAAYEALSRADIFLGRVRRRQYYGLWSYATDMMTCGVSLAKSKNYMGQGRATFPTWLMKMSRSRGIRETRGNFAAKLGKFTHASNRMALQDVLPYFKILYTQDREFRLYMTKRLNLTEEEVGFLLDVKSDTHPVKHVFDALEKMQAVSRPPEKAEEPDPVEESETEPAAQPEETKKEEPKQQKSLFEFG
ncbi:MAG: replication factor C large subunit [Thermoplasmata archaeon]|nr:replication factor C large subunit [Thermoplasmata archaeon]